MKKWLSVAAVVVLCLSLVIGAACGGGKTGEEGVKELKFGFGLPLSVLVGAVVGLPARDALNMANEEMGVFEVGGQKYRWKLFFEDNKFNSAGGVASATKLIFEDHVDFMFQLGADATMAAYPYCHERKVILDGSGLPATMLGPDKPYLFQTNGTWDYYWPNFFDWVSREHPELHKVVCVSSDDLMGHGVLDPINKNCDYYGLDYTNIWIPPTGITPEWYPIVTKVMSHDPDIVYISQQAYDAMWEMGYKGIFFETDFEEELWGEPNWDKAAGHVYLTGLAAQGPWPEVKAFRERYKERYGLTLMTYAAGIPMSLWAWTAILQEAGTADFENDLDKIMETAETAVVDCPYGQFMYTGEVINGIGHCGTVESTLNVVSGPRQYELIRLLTVEENAAMTHKIYSR